MFSPLFRCLLLLLALPSSTNSLWTTLGRDSYRSNAEASVGLAFLPSEVRPSCPCASPAAP